MKPFLLFFASLLLQSCIVVPRTEVIYDPQCQIRFKQMRLDTKVFKQNAGQGPGQAMSCQNNASCLAQLAVLGGVSAASMVISGSIVVVGNTVYWLEKQGRCLTDPALIPPASQSEPSPEVDEPGLRAGR